MSTSNRVPHITPVGIDLTKAPTIERTIKARGGFSTKLPRYFALDNQPSPDILQGEPGVIICRSAEQLLVHLHKHYQEHSYWQYRITPVQRHMMGENGQTLTRQYLVVNYLGFRRTSGRTKGRYWYPLSPDNIGDFLLPNDELESWGNQVVDFCESMQIRPSPTSGGIAAQLLKHSQFHRDRRRVPRSTNERFRNRMPGNYYHRRAKTAQIHKRATYIDQRDAHHHAAATLALPHADALFCRGSFRHVNDETGKYQPPPQVRDARKRQGKVRGHGIAYVVLRVPDPIMKRPYPPPYLKPKSDGIHEGYIYTNELSEAIRLGCTLVTNVAGWTSDKVDHGMKRYAEWAMSLDRPPWLKATTLAAYGILAARPRQHESWYHYAVGERKRVFIGGEPINTAWRRTNKEISSGIANVIQRGMIEAETRRRSVELARELTECGLKVLSIYADGVIIDGVPQLPFLTEPWRVKHILHDLAFIDDVSFVSREITRTPGIPRHRRDTYLAEITQQRKGVKKNGNVRQGQRVRQKPKPRVPRGGGVRTVPRRDNGDYSDLTRGGSQDHPNSGESSRDGQPGISVPSEHSSECHRGQSDGIGTGARATGGGLLGRSAEQLREQSDRAKLGTGRTARGPPELPGAIEYGADWRRRRPSLLVILDNEGKRTLLDFTTREAVVPLEHL